MKYLLGIDFGGGASKATLINTEGKLIADNTVEYATYHPSADMCEQIPEEWYDALCRNTHELLCKSGVNPSDILAAAVDSATHTAVLCDGSFEVIRPAIHWTDSRSREESRNLSETNLKLITDLTYHKPDTIWTLPQLIWLKKHEPESFAKIRHIFFEKDYLRMRLTGEYGTDYIEAEGSMLFDYNKLQWSNELCGLCGLDCSVLPPLMKPSDIAGKITPKAAVETGLAIGTPVICGTTDTVLEVFASGAVTKGSMTVKLATAGRICVITGKAYPHKHLINYSHIVDGLWYPGTATKSCAASYRWYRDTFDGNYRELDKAASEIAAGCGGLMFHPYLNGELTPYADPTLCGSFTGIRSIHTKAHFTRAVLEGVSLSLLDCKNALEDIGIPHGDSAVIIGGGAKSPLWRQITADMLGFTLRTTMSSDSSLGSAMLAGIASGVFSSAEDAVEKCVVFDSFTVPNPENTEKYASIFKTYKQIHDALAPVYNTLNT